MARVLVCDDEELIRWSLREHLEKHGYDVEVAEDGEKCLEVIGTFAPDALILDLKMPKKGGLEVLREVRARGLDVPTVVITAHGGIESAIEATRLGASGYLAKPFDLREITLQVAQALEKRRLRDEVHYLRNERTAQYDRIVGKAPSMQKVFDMLKRLESVDAPTVLITGESGTGKDLVAQAIHRKGPRRDKPFMEIDCASLPEQLIESALFGHEKGSFTDAKATKPGLFEVAHDGVVFLDEIGEMPLEMQAKLLRALENRRFKRVGGVKDLPIHANVIAATNRDLRQEVEAGRFREDLFYRLHVIPIAIPPLRNRVEDIPLIVDTMLTKLNGEVGREFEGISGEALECMQRYRWPGNVRELRNVVERAVILHADAKVIDVEHLPAEVVLATQAAVRGKGCPFVLPEDGVDLEAVEHGLLEQALERTGGNQSQAARLLGISRYALRYRMSKQKEKESQPPADASA